MIIMIKGKKQRWKRERERERERERLREKGGRGSSVINLMFRHPRQHLLDIL